MNFLAHFYLANPTAASRAGNFLGDYITGTPESLAEVLPAELLEGIIMHRRIDALTDSHANFAEAKVLLGPERRRFAGIILDMFTDHFLARNWEQYSELTLAKFSEQVNDELHQYWQFFPENAKREAESMIDNQWFQRYQTIEGLEQSLTGISRSRKNFDPIANSSENLRAHYDQYQLLCTELLAGVKAEIHNF